MWDFWKNSSEQSIDKGKQSIGSSSKQKKYCIETLEQSIGLPGKSIGSLKKLKKMKTESWGQSIDPLC